MSSLAIESLYTTPLPASRVDFPDHPMHPVPSHLPAQLDFRRSIMQLQLLAQKGALEDDGEPSNAVLSAAARTSASQEDAVFERLADWPLPWYASSEKHHLLAAERSPQTDASVLRSLSNFMDYVSFTSCIRRTDIDEMEVSYRAVVIQWTFWLIRPSPG